MIKRSSQKIAINTQAEKIIEISAKFIVEQDESVIIDATNPTSLKDEYLLNKGPFRSKEDF